MAIRSFHVFSNGLDQPSPATVPYCRILSACPPRAAAAEQKSPESGPEAMLPAIKDRQSIIHPGLKIEIGLADPWRIAKRRSPAVRDCRFHKAPILFFPFPIFASGPSGVQLFLIINATKCKPRAAAHRLDGIPSRP